MGLDNRDYLKDEAARYSGGGGGGSFGGRGSFGADSPTCFRILIVTIVVFLLQMFSIRNWNQAELQVERERVLEQYQTALEYYRESQPVLPETDAEISEATKFQKEQELDLATRMEELKLTERLTPEMLGLPNRRTSVVQNWLQLETPKVLSGQVWRLVTCAFCHDRNALGHIIFNMFLMWVFGRRLESMYGSKEFLLFYLSGAMVASICYMVIDLMTGVPIPMIGASGAVMAIVTLYAWHYPTDTIYVFFVIPVEMRWVVVFYALYDLHPLLMQAAGELPTDNVAHAAHLGGLAFGYLYATKRFRLSNYVSGFDTWFRKRRRGFRVVSDDSPSPRMSRKSQQLADAMDAILKKISEEGEGALTDAERKTLADASRELRDRRG